MGIGFLLIYFVIFLAMVVGITIAIIAVVKGNKMSNEKREQYYEDIHKIAENSDKKDN